MRNNPACLTKAYAHADMLIIRDQNEGYARQIDGACASNGQFVCPSAMAAVSWYADRGHCTLDTSPVVDQMCDFSDTSSAPAGVEDSFLPIH